MRTTESKQDLIKTLKYVKNNWSTEPVIARNKAIGFLLQYINDLEVWKAAQQVWNLDEDFYDSTR